MKQLVDVSGCINTELHPLCCYLAIIPRVKFYDCKMDP